MTKNDRLIQQIKHLEEQLKVLKPKRYTNGTLAESRISAQGW